MSSVGADPFLALSTHDKPAPPEPMTKQWGMGPQFEIGYSSVRLGSKCFSSSSTESFFFHGGSTRFFFNFVLCEAGPRRHWPRLLESISGLAEFFVSAFVHPSVYFDFERPWNFGKFIFCSSI